MISDEQLQAKLERISRRMQANRGQLLSALEQHPELLSLANLVKATFGTHPSGNHLRIGPFENQPEPEWLQHGHHSAAEMGPPLMQPAEALAQSKSKPPRKRR